MASVGSNSAVRVGQYWARVLVFCHINNPQLFFLRNHIKCQSLLIYERGLALHLLRKNMNLYKNEKILAIHYYIYTFLILLHIFYIIITIILTLTEVFVDIESQPWEPLTVLAKLFSS